MRGAGNSNYIQDPTKRAEWASQLAERKELSIEDLLSYFPVEWVRTTDIHQRKLGETSLATLIEKPFLPSSTKVGDEAVDLQKIASNNVAIYDDATEDQIYDDEIMQNLQNDRNKYKGDESYSSLVRSRRTILAYMAHAAISNDSAA